MNTQPVSFASMKRIGNLIQETTLIQLAPLTEISDLEKAGKEPTTKSGAFAGREGYVSTFIEQWRIKLPMPKDEQLLTPLRDGSGYELKYHHFSVLMSKNYRLPMLTAVNLNGALPQKVGRISVWSFDGRIDKSAQWGDEIYDNNLLDRGHMVRREDPIWGDHNDAEIANRDTFHFTNSCPQIGAINQKTWLGLENYVLLNARADGMKVSVFTGPYFSDKDLEYRGAKIPQAFWKIVAFLGEDGRPSATAYEISQAKELTDLEFVYQQYKTFQISINRVIELTGIDFSELARYDGFSDHELATNTTKVEEIKKLDDIMV